MPLQSLGPHPQADTAQSPSNPAQTASQGQVLLITLPLKQKHLGHSQVGVVLVEVEVDVVQGG